MFIRQFGIVSAAPMPLWCVFRLIGHGRTLGIDRCQPV